MTQLSGYLAMGGYATYVWAAFAITAVVLTGLLLTSWRRFHAQKAMLARLEQQAGGGRRRAARAGGATKITADGGAEVAPEAAAGVARET